MNGNSSAASTCSLVFGIFVFTVVVVVVAVVVEKEVLLLTGGGSLDCGSFSLSFLKG